MQKTSPRPSKFFEKPRKIGPGGFPNAPKTLHPKRFKIEPGAVQVTQKSPNGDPKRSKRCRMPPRRAQVRKIVPTRLLRGANDEPTPGVGGHVAPP